MAAIFVMMAEIDLRLQGQRTVRGCLVCGMVFVQGAVVHRGLEERECGLRWMERRSDISLFWTRKPGGTLPG